MGIPRSLKEIKNILAANEFELAQDSEYKSTKKKTRVIDKRDGKEYFIYIANLLQGYSCRKRVVTKEEVIDTLDKEGYKLIGDYINTKQELLVECPRGHQFTTLFNTFTSGKRCRECFYYSRMQTNQEIASRLAVCNYTLLTTDERISHLQKIDVKCDRGHIFQTDMKHFMIRGHRCPTCSTIKQRTPIEQVREAFSAVGLTLLSESHDDSVLHFVCKKGHRSSVTWQNFVWGCRCDQCTNKADINEIREVFRLEGYQLLDDGYADNKTKMRAICPKGHEFKTSWNNWCYGSRCSVCCLSSSKAEQDLYKIIKDLFPGAISRHKVENNQRLELDVFVPEKSVGIEFNGIFWHSDGAVFRAYNKGMPLLNMLKECRLQHITKYNACKERGIILLNIFEDDWKNKKQAVLSTIKSALGLDESITADECIIVNVSQAHADHFVLENSIQDPISSSFNIGLTHQGTLVLLVAVTINQAMWVTVFKKSGVTVTGGISKAVLHLRQQKRLPIITKCDLSYDNGAAFLEAGFSPVETTEPLPHITSSKKRVLFTNPDKEYGTIWDCGHLILIHR